MNIDHDYIGIFDCRDGDNVDILDRGAISGVNSYAVECIGVAVHAARDCDETS